MANNNQGGNQGNQDKRGFASMDPNKQREIASEGGRAAHASGNAHEFTSQEAQEAGRMSHKNTGGRDSENQGSGSGSGTRGGSSAQHAEAGRQSHKNQTGSTGNQGSEGAGTRGGSNEQHREAGKQSHKNQK